MNKKIKEWEQANSSFTYNEEFVYKQIKRSKRNTLFIKTMQICTCCITLLFVLVNTSESYVKATQDILLLNKLNNFFDLTPSVSIAIDNNYIQEINLTKEDGDFKVIVDKMVVDKNSVYLFYKAYYQDERIDFNNDLFGLGYMRVGETANTGAEMRFDKTEEYDVVALVFRQTYDFEKTKVNDFAFNFKYQDQVIRFRINADEDKIAQPKILNVNQIINIKGNKLQITKIEIYPLSMRIYTKQDLNNIALIRNIEFEIIGFYNDELETRQWEMQNGQYMITLTSPYFYEGDIQIKLKSVELAEKVSTATFNTETNEWNDPTNLTSLNKVLYLRQHPYEINLDIRTNKQSDDLVLVDLENEAKYIKIYEIYGVGNYNKIYINISKDAIENNKELEFNIYKLRAINMNKSIKLK